MRKVKSSDWLPHLVVSYYRPCWFLLLSSFSFTFCDLFSNSRFCSFRFVLGAFDLPIGMFNVRRSFGFVFFDGSCLRPLQFRFPSADLVDRVRFEKQLFGKRIKVRAITVCETTYGHPTEGHTMRAIGQYSKWSGNPDSNAFFLLSLE